MTAFFGFRIHQYALVGAHLLVSFFEQVLIAIYALAILFGLAYVFDTLGVPPINTSEPKVLTEFGEWLVPILIPWIVPYGTVLVFLTWFALQETRRALQGNTVLADMRMKAWWLIKWNPISAPATVFFMLVR